MITTTIMSSISVNPYGRGCLIIVSGFHDYGRFDGSDDVVWSRHPEDIAVARHVSFSAKLCVSGWAGGASLPCVAFQAAGLVVRATRLERAARLNQFSVAVGQEYRHYLR